MLNVFQPSLALPELASVANVMQSNWIGKGKKVEQFEELFAAHLRVSPENVASTTSCTEGLFQVMSLIDVKGKEVILPSIHFIGAANAIIANGGIPVFCDVDRQSLNTEARYIEPLITRKTKAIVMLHYGGYGAKMGEIMALADKHELVVIEDAACSPDTWIDDRACGTIGHFGVWSFDAMKIISTGDGGMIYARDPGHIKDLRRRLYLGMDEGSGYNSPHDKWWEFKSCYPGRRAITNDLTAAIGIEQLKQLRAFVGQRATLCSMYLARLAPELVPARNYPNASHYFFWIQTERRDELARYLKEKGIYTTFRYYPLHRALGRRAELPNTDWVTDRTLLLPLHQGLRYFDIDYICECVGEFE